IPLELAHSSILPTTFSGRVREPPSPVPPSARPRASPAVQFQSPSPGGNTMQTLADHSPPATAHRPQSAQDAPALRGIAGNAWADCKVIRRNGSVVAFEPSKISIAVTKAFLAVGGGQGAASARVREL